MENKILDRIKKLNNDQEIFSIYDNAFVDYGRTLESEPFSELCDLLEKNTVITENNVYIANEKELFSKRAYEFALNIFGGIEIQIGYCNGMNQTLNGMEYHKSPEIIVAATDILLFLAKPCNLIDFTSLDSKAAKVFFAPKGSVISLNPSILHLSPSCVHQSGFKSAIILPKGTNLDLKENFECEDKESQILFKTNKWIITHKDRKPLVNQGVKIGITGVNTRLIPIND